MGRSKGSRRVRQAPKYHGLFNQGATCYLNSVLQVLFMTKDFREAVERYTDENRDTIDRQLKSLFSDLQKSSAYTYNITRALGINRVYEQRDAAEYIERILRLTDESASQIFHGLLSHRTKCCKCGTVTDRDEAFWHLPLALLDSCSDGYSVVDSIDDFFRASVFSGEDQMYCDSCDDKADATAQYVMKRHPDVLILLLKRFEFSYRHMSYVKISHVVDVPATIEIPERQTYKLYAVVDHFGGLRGGHYTATIKDEGEDRWYHFNDSRVSLCDYQPFQVDNSKSSARSQTAQLLFYRKMEEAVIQDNMSTNHSQCEDAEKTRQRDEGEDDVEMGDDTAVAVSVGENGVTGNEGVVRDVSRGVGLSEEPDNEGNAIQNGTHRNQEDNEDRRDDYRQDGSVNMQKIEEGTQREDDDEDMRGKVEADVQTQNSRLVNVETKQTESIKNETAESDTDKERRLDANFKPEVSVQPQIRDLPNQQDETNYTQSRVMDATTDKDEMTGDKETEKPPVDCSNRDTEYLNEGGLDKQNRNEGQGSSLKTRQQFDPDKGRRSDARPIISKNPSVEILVVEEKDNVKNEDEGFGQKNVTKQAKEKGEKGDPEQFHNREDSGQEGTVRGERENQERGSGQRRVHNKGQDNQPDVESVQHSDKDTGPTKRNKHKRPRNGNTRFFKRGKKRTGAAEETGNSSHHDQSPGSLTESVNSSMTTELAVQESKKGRKKKQHGKEKEKKQKTRRWPWYVPNCLRSHESAEQSGEED